MSNNEKILEATESIADEIRVRRVVIMGEDGEEKAILDVNEQGGASLVLLGPEETRVVLGATKEGSVLLLSKGLSQAGISATNEISIVEMYNSKGILGAFLASADGGGSCAINNHNGFAGTVLRTSKAGGGIVDVLSGGVKGTLSASGAGGSLQLLGIGSTTLRDGNIEPISGIHRFKWPPSF